MTVMPTPPRQILTYKVGIEMDPPKYAVVINGQAHEFAPGKSLTADWGLAEKTYWAHFGRKRADLFISPHRNARTLNDALLNARLDLAMAVLDQQEDLFQALVFAQGGLDEFHIFGDGSWSREDPHGESVWTIKADDRPRAAALRATREVLAEQAYQKQEQLRSLS